MLKQHPVLGMLALLVLGAHAADVPVQTCEQIREEIMTVKGLTVAANAELLQKISLRSDCHFTSTEVYRAAYGDKPLPPHRQHNENRHDNDD
jgi:hypothetical protein